MAEYLEREGLLRELRLWNLHKAEPDNFHYTELKAWLEALPAEDVQPVSWIPVTEQLPESYTWVLVSAEGHNVAFDAFYDGAQWNDAVLNGLIVTHWMPLPELPKEE